MLNGISTRNAAIAATLCFFLSGCSHPKSSLSLMHIIDKNGFEETVSGSERLDSLSQANFMESQPYEKVTRIFSSKKSPSTHGVITSYHSNGNIKQHLEIRASRAHGVYREWHESGQLSVDAFVVEGVGDISDDALQTFVFDGESTVYYPSGAIRCTFNYDVGKLNGKALYYFENGTIAKQETYSHGNKIGIHKEFSESSECTAQKEYVNDNLHGISRNFKESGEVLSEEVYKNGTLVDGLYYDEVGNVSHRVEECNGHQVEYKNGVCNAIYEICDGVKRGNVDLYKDNMCVNTYSHKDGVKHGQEWVYDRDGSTIMYTEWYNGMIQGSVKTWYANGTLESHRTFVANEKVGPSYAWYENGDTMLVEEYEKDRLVSGSYYKVGEDHPISSVDSGTGCVVLYDQNGQFIQRINYEGGVPQ